MIRRLLISGAGLVTQLLCGVVLAQCTASINPGPIIVCGGQALNLTGSGTGAPPLSFSWTGSPHLSSTNTANTTFNYPVPVNTVQVVNLTLTVTASDGCTNTASIAVTVNPTANALMTANSPSVVFDGATTFFRCVPVTNPNFLFDFTGSATAGSTHTIDWGDGSPVFTTTGNTWPQQAHTFSSGITDITYTITQ
ncbi:MAG TPA: hypothetical protein PL070_09785, partial [Flavobacteriales bacterium]|nr:hypothetical protein [Flavobacteriales bacterium]